MRRFYINMVRTLTLIVIVSLMALNASSQGDRDITLRAQDTLITDSLLKYQNVLIPLLDVTYHEFSDDAVSWHKAFTIGDIYLRFSNDTKVSWYILDIQTNWLNDGTNIYTNSSILSGDVWIDTVDVSGYKLYVNGDVNADYYFIGEDSLAVDNIFNGGDGSDGDYLQFSGDTSIWVTVAPGSGENTMSNVGANGVGVYDSKLGANFQMRNVATGDTFIDVTLNAPDSTIDLTWDGTGRNVLAGVGLTGGGDLGADRTINFNMITGFPTYPGSDSVRQGDDWLVIYNVDSAIHYKIHPDDLLAVLGVYVDSIGIELDGNAFYLGTPSEINEITTNNVVLKTHTHSFDMSTFELIDIGDVDGSPTAGQFLKWTGTQWETDAVSGVGNPIDLYITDVLKESSISVLNLYEGQGISMTYGGSGKVTVAKEWGVTTLTGTTPSLNPLTQTLDAELDISGNTTLTLTNLVAGMTGNITVTCDAAGYTLEFAGYTDKISPFVESTAGVITTTAGAGAVDCYSYFYDGTYLIINGTKNYDN